MATPSPSSGLDKYAGATIAVTTKALARRSPLPTLAVTSEAVLLKRKFVRRRSIGHHRYIVSRVSLRSYKNG